MKYFVLLSAIIAVSCSGSASHGSVSSETACPFRDSISLAATPVKNQARTSTCWSFGGISLLESEILRRGGDTTDLSEMWIVRHTWFDKAVKYVRLNGGMNLAAGGEVRDVLYAAERYGIVPQHVYDGRSADGEYDHGELSRAVIRCAERIVSRRKYLNDGWQEEIDAVLDEYLGKCPETFVIDGRQYTPKSYADSLGIRSGDYAAFTSFTHHPFYQSFPIEIPDNWLWRTSANLPLDELEALVDSALSRGYTVAWTMDLSEDSFNRGIAVLPADTSLTADALPRTEIEVDAKLRQQWFDNRTTTDDHIMHIVGMATDGEGRKYYKVKNSYGPKQTFGGYYYVSAPYLRGKTIEITVNREAADPELLRRCGL